MKNTTLAKMPNILNYKEELYRVKPLEKTEYTFREAARFFGCIPSQISGYCYSYKELFEKHIKLDNSGSKKLVMLNSDAMFLMALLLGKKTDVSNAVFNNVLNRIGGEQINMNNMIEEKTIESNAKIKKPVNDSIFNFEDLKKIKKTKKTDEEIDFIKVEIGPNGLEVTPIKMSEKEAKEMVDKTRFALSEMPEEFADLLGDIREKVMQKLIQDEEYMEDDYQEESDDCNCPSCLEEAFNEKIQEKSLQGLELESTLDMQYVYTSKYMRICEALGIDKLDAAIMIQNSITEESENIDSDILEYLLSEKREIANKQSGIIKESIRLLAEEKFDNVKDAFIIIAQEVRYVLGLNLIHLIEDLMYDEFIETIVYYKAFDQVMNIIHKYLME